MTDIYQLKKGETYKVIKPFIDFDKVTHKVGETWVFDKITYLPYHSGLSLFVIENSVNKQYHFQDIVEEQEELLSNFIKYIEKL
jgi:hypothetical protein